MNFLKKIADGKIDGHVHLQFQKFSKGEFQNRALIKAKKSGNKYTLKTSAEFANELVRVMAEKLNDKKTDVSGAIITTMDLSSKLSYKEIKQFQGVKKYIIGSEMSGKEIIKLLEEFPKTFFALSFKTFDGDELKIKPKAPKSGKQKTKDENEIKADFCKLTTTDEEIAKSFVFEKPNFKSAELKHTFFIDKIIFPDGEKDFSKIRELAKREGRIIREGEIDEKSVKKELVFRA